MPETLPSDVRNASSCLVHKDVDLSFCYLPYEFLATLLPCLHYVTNISLDYSSITILPSCINACYSLKKLTMSNCMELREIRGLPPNIKHLTAINCESLISQSKEMLLNQMLLNSGIKCIIYPGSTIPSWFHQRTCEQSLSFWFRNKLPEMALCLVGVLGGCLPTGRRVEYIFDVIIDSNQRINHIFYVRWLENSLFDTNHIFLLDVQLKASLDMIGGLQFENGWNHAELLLVKSGGEYMKWTRVYVREQMMNMPDILFVNPEVPIGKENKEVTCGDKRSQKILQDLTSVLFAKKKKKKNLTSSSTLIMRFDESTS